MVGGLAHTPNQYKMKRGDNIMKIGYIKRHDLKLDSHLSEKFRFREAACTRRISSRGDKIYSTLFIRPIDYEEVTDNTNLMKENQGLIIVNEPFFVDDELRDKVVKWVEWANKAKPEEYDPWYKGSVSNE